MSYAGKNPGILRTRGEKGVVSDTALVQSTHQATINALALPLGKTPPKVHVGGNGYCIVAYFPARLLIDKLCDHARWYPEKALTRDDLDAIVRDVNYEQYHAPTKRIHVAGLPPSASRNVKNAAIAGCLHEEAHDLYTRQEPLDADEVAAIVLPRWNSVSNWAPYKGLLLQAANIFEDVFIERLLCAMYPGVRPKMAALQDFILTMEDKSREEAGAELTPISALMGLIRDLGLGYKTKLQREVIASYREAHADVCDLILTGKGKPMMKEAMVDVSTKEAIEETRTKTMLSTKLALDLVILMEEVGGAPPEEDGEGEGEGGQGQQACCPNCKAPASKLRSKAVKHDDTKIAITCTECGWQEIMDKPEPQEGGEGEGSEGGISIETGDPQDGNSGGGSGESIKFDDSEEADNESKAGEPQDSEEGEEGEEQDGEGSEGEGSEDGDQSEGSEGSEAGEEGDSDSDSKNEDGKNEDGKIDNLWDGSRPDSPTQDADSDAGDAQGEGSAQWGAAQGETQDEAQSPTLGDLIDSIKENGAGDLMDYAQALGGETVREIEEFIKSDVKEGEAHWNPLSTSGDKVVWPKINGEWEKSQGKAITKSVRRECAYLLARLRQIVNGQDEVIVDDGCPKGRKLSARNLVNTYSQVTSFERPDRAFKRIDEEELPSTAATVVVDESGSMCNILQEAGQISAAIAMPLDALGAKVMVHGIRSGSYYSDEVAPNHDRSIPFHRSGGVNHDIIKGFDEPYRTIEGRFAKLRAEGGTPLSDGIQFSMDNLEYRDEDNKIIFVVTDGWPNGGHVPVINRQIRLCKERGWHIIGVGVGYDAQYVQNLFPDSVYSETVADIPKLLVKKLNELLTNGTVKRRSVRSA